MSGSAGPADAVFTFVFADDGVVRVSGDVPMTEGHALMIVGALREKGLVAPLQEERAAQEGWGGLVVVWQAPEVWG